MKGDLRLCQTLTKIRVSNDTEERTNDMVQRKNPMEQRKLKIVRSEISMQANLCL